MHDKVFGKFRIVSNPDQTVLIDYAVLTGNHAPGTMVRRQMLLIPAEDLKDLHDALRHALASNETSLPSGGDDDTARRTAAADAAAGACRSA